MLTLHEAITKLNEFTSVAGLVDFLKSEGIKGDMGDCLTCPIATWLNYRVPREPYIKVDWDFLRSNCSTVVRNFVGGFDDGGFAELNAFAVEL